MHVRRATSAVFAYRERDIGMLFAQGVEMRAQLVRLPVIPSEVTVRAYGIDSFGDDRHVLHAALLATIGKDNCAVWIKFAGESG